MNTILCIKIIVVAAGTLQSKPWGHGFFISTSATNVSQLADLSTAGRNVFTSITSSTMTDPNSTSNSESTMYQEAPVEPLLQFCPPLTFRIPGVEEYTKAGISKDCQYVYFYNTQRILVHRLSIPSTSAVSGASTPSHEIFNSGRKFKNAMISRVALSGQYIAISTKETLEVFDMTTANLADNSTSARFRRPHGRWQTNGLAILKQNSTLSIVIGQRKQGISSYEGRVLLFAVELSAPWAQSTSLYCLYNVPRKDFPKNVEISADGTLILCRTQLSNTIIIWKIPSGSDQCAFQLTRSCYIPVSPFALA